MTRMKRTEGNSPLEHRAGGDLISDYDFDLPSRLVAQHPAEVRSSSRCFFCTQSSSIPTEAPFHSIADRLVGDELLVVNDTRVLPARIRCTRSSGWLKSGLGSKFGVSTQIGNTCNKWGVITQIGSKCNKRGVSPQIGSRDDGQVVERALGSFRSLN